MTEIWRSTDGVPDGWARVVKQRVAGASAGTIDLYILSPSGKFLRSKTDLQAYLVKEGITNASVSDFEFSKKSLPKEIQSASLPRSAGTTPVKSSSAAPKRKPDLSKSDSKPKKFTSPAVVPGVVKKAKDKSSSAPVSSKLEKSSKKDVSPYDFLLEHYLDDDWKFVMAALFMEVHGRQETPDLRQTLEAFFKRFPKAGELHNSGWISVCSYLQGRGYHEKFAQHLTYYTFDFVANQQEPKENRLKAHEINGATEYVHYCYRIFVLKELKFEKHLDYDASVYRDWLLNRREVQALLEDA